MSTADAQVGGFVGDINEAFAPAASGGCCGSPSTATVAVDEQAATCCGATPAAAVSPVTSDAGCCG